MSPTGAPPRRRRPHIANIDHPRVFASAFAGVREARKFHKSLEGKKGARHTALQIINQTARMLWLADKVRKVSAGRPALQIMFFMFAAEAVAKLFTDYQRESESKAHVRKFFLSICTDEHRRRLVTALTGRDSSFPRVEAEPAAVVECLYRIRCDVVHRWNYFGLYLKDEVTAELRAIVLEGAAHAAKTLAARQGT